PYAVPDERLEDAQAEREMSILQELVTRARNLRAEAGIAPGKRVELTLVAASDEMAALAERNRDALGTLIRLESLNVTLEEPPTGVKALTAPVEAGTLVLPLGDAADIQREIERLTAEREAIRRDVEKAQAKLSNPGFTSKAPAEVVEKQRRIVEDLTARMEAIEERLRILT
ncbi:MAG: hypothetical protein WHZ52_01720, partial [Armatimonadota bacterium]